jgi:hypothetical protein
MTHSIAYSIYKNYPTAISRYSRKADINGLNFAFIGDHIDYHTKLIDTYENLDPQHTENIRQLPHAIIIVSGKCRLEQWTPK